MESSGPPHYPPGGDRFSCPPVADHSRGGDDPRVNWGPTPVPPSGGTAWTTVPLRPRRNHRPPSDSRPSSPEEENSTASTSTVVVRPVAQRLRREIQVLSRSRNSTATQNGNQMNSTSSTVGTAELSKACGGPASFECRNRWIQTIQGTRQEDYYFVCTLCGTQIQGQDAVTLVYPSGTPSDNTGCWSNDDIENHLCSNLHRRNVEEHFCRAMRVLKTRDYAATLDHRIDNLQDPNKRIKLYARIGRAVVKDQERFTRFSLQVELTRFERMEAVYCLELAVWKTVCCLEPHKKMESIVAFQQWMKEGWKQNKASRWRCNQMNIIMNNVVPFLTSFR